MPRVLFAGLFHETHTFLAARTTLADFQRICACEGDEILSRCRRDASPVGGFILVAYRENPHTDAHEIACRTAQLLARIMQERQFPVMTHLHLPLIQNSPSRQMECWSMRLPQ